MSHEEFAQKIKSRQRRRMMRGFNVRCKILVDRLLKAKKSACPRSLPVPVADDTLTPSLCPALQRPPLARGPRV